jgi:hypothetical protein
MRKLELELDSLIVESFATGAAEPALEVRGTVAGQEVTNIKCGPPTLVYPCVPTGGCP